jgi:lyso-ornithine lipid O-acyltransferase
MDNIKEMEFGSEVKQLSVNSTKPVFFWDEDFEVLPKIKIENKKVDIEENRKSLFLAIYRMFLMFFYMIFYLVKLFLSETFRGRNKYYALELRQRFQIKLVKILGIKINVVGGFGKEPGIIISNHRSYIDPLIIMSYKISIPIGKLEVKSWPLIGYGLDKTCTIWVNRSDKSSKENSRIQMKNSLKSRFSILIFPEGTTSKGPGILKMEKGVFEIASELNAWVTPVSVVYKNVEDSWTDNQKFLPHFIKTFSKKYTEVSIEIFDPMKDSNATILQVNVENLLQNLP